MTLARYDAFLATKRLVAPSVGLTVSDIHQMLFPFQRALTQWAIRKGRAAIFADTGLGKTFMQIEWARNIPGNVLIVAPLSIARQTVREGQKLGTEIIYSRTGRAPTTQITITNYEMVTQFDPAEFAGVVLDESSILKSLDGKTRERLTAMFQATPYRLCCTATPAPNDITEIANHAEFLGVMSRTDMLASFFVHDDKGWRLKGHAVEPFYRWLASWGMSVKKPSDLGYDDDGYVLPELTIKPSWVESEYRPSDKLFAVGLEGIQGRNLARRQGLAPRMERALDLVSGIDQWIIWCGLNDEGRALHKALPDSVLMEGSQSLEEKQSAIEGFQDGKHRILITKPKMGGFGLNLQNCHNMLFFGLTDSFEAYYQCIRRCWRYGQSYPVNVHIVLSEVEREILENVERKEEEAVHMTEQLIANVQQFERTEIGVADIDWQYTENEASGKHWRMLLGDSVQRLGELPDDSIALSVFSPPFLSLYTYSPSERDIGNNRTETEFFMHFGYIIDHLLRVTKPGRVAVVHCADVPAMLSRDGFIGLKDFPGMTIAAFGDRGWVYQGRVTIDKNPQVQAIRTHAKGLMFGSVEKDASWARPGLADYLLIFRSPGESEPIKPEMTRQEWILWARPVWYAADYLPGSYALNGGDYKEAEAAGIAGIRETDTLNVAGARSEDDERHIAPLQIGTIERCIRLWSNPGETVLSPFGGIGSEGYVAIKHKREYIGIELKPEYWKQAVKNLRDAETALGQVQLELL